MATIDQPKPSQPKPTQPDQQPLQPGGPVTSRQGTNPARVNKPKSDPQKDTNRKQ